MEHDKGVWYWTVDEKGRPLHLRSAFKDGSGSKHILFTSNDFMGEYAFENAEANAERIVKAVNFCGSISTEWLNSHSLEELLNEDRNHAHQ